MKSLASLLCMAIVLTHTVARAGDEPATPVATISGIFASFSGDRDTVGRVALQWTGKSEDSTSDSYKIVWTVDQQVQVGVGFLTNNVLTVGWPSGIGRYELDRTTPDRPMFKGWSMKIGDPGKTFDHSLVFMRPIRDDEYFKGDVVAVDYEEDEYWYYARIEEKTDKGYKVSYLAGDGEADVAVENIKRYQIRVKDIIVTTARDGLDYFAEVVAVSSTPTWVSEDDTVTLNYLDTDENPTGEIEKRNIRFIRFVPRSDATESGEGEKQPEETTGSETESAPAESESGDSNSPE